MPTFELELSNLNLVARAAAIAYSRVPQVFMKVLMDLSRD